ncbi:MAG: hypothetical protein ACLFWB_11965, partial [Armatimonadota bacterium]
YMIHRLYPKYRVFFDGRMDMYPRELCDDYQTINHAEAGWEEIAQKHGVEWGFVMRSQDLFDALKDNENWALVFVTNKGGIFVRLAGPNGHFVRESAQTGGYFVISSTISRSFWKSARIFSSGSGNRMAAAG